MAPASLPDPNLTVTRQQLDASLSPQYARQKKVWLNMIAAQDMASLRECCFLGEQAWCSGDSEDDSLDSWKKPLQPRPTNGIFVAIIVMNNTFVSSGKVAM